MIIDKQQVIREHPLPLGVDDWYFKLVELSNCHWHLKAASLYGLTLSYEGGDDAELIERCKTDAVEFNRKYKT